MKKNKKLITMLSAAMIMTAPAAIVANSNQTYAAQSTDQRTNEKQGTLTLNHSTRVYNKNGQKLRSYNGGSSLLKKGAAIAYSGKVQSLTDPSSKRYSYHDDEWNWFYLPYKTIKGKEYYSIGHGGYIKAVNVKKINGQFVYINEINGSTVESGGHSKIALYDSHGRQLDKYLKPGKKLIFDRTANIDDFDAMNDVYNGIPNFYRIKNTDEFISTHYTKVNLRQELHWFSDYTQVGFINDAKTYDRSGKITKTIFKKGDICTVSRAVSTIDPDTNTTVTFYQVSNDTNLFIKASDVKYIDGPKLDLSNTAEDVQVPTVPNK
ncbi:SLAP domain-containing protein [Lactobacillus sp. ESL0791]|uniref:SLAP domain-containing protein n=1 Tax=Lactobacillus sp. ESL0791 TaxID=2983234 RepID=UPI0023F88AD7|nr:SLAP domain-containing protein [Lactobacillus sp. ESL0791]MDF7638443.1 SLAP domain-containing protein [Lactobacillus sp. ESL0791]